MPLIQVQNLTKTFHILERTAGFFNTLSSAFKGKYRQVQALKDISFEVHEGDMIGYIGPNGAGKSTTLKILSGILTPDKGQVSVFGRTPWQHRIETVQKIGVVFGQRTQLWWELPVIESFELLREIYQIPFFEWKETLEELVDRLNLSRLIDTPVRNLSLGQRVKADLAASLLHRPKLLFLDEPTIGLDAASKIAVRQFILELNQKRQVTIILTTHDMDDIESLCRRVLVVNQGSLFLDDSLEALRQLVTSERWLIVDLEEETDFIHIENAQFFKKEGKRIWLRFDPSAIKTTDLIQNVVQKYAIRDLFVENPPIEEIIAALYSRNKLSRLSRNL
ncbi:MAG: transporter related protein [Chlamydiales bacterium]|jgi:ABC-2 type transport system ATP-binding protein|nr:transporter related protein [Chlamydiales bacterium]